MVDLNGAFESNIHISSLSPSINSFSFSFSHCFMNLWNKRISCQQHTRKIIEWETRDQMQEERKNAPPVNNFLCVIHQLSNTRPKYSQIVLKIYEWFVATFCVAVTPIVNTELVRRKKNRTKSRIEKVSSWICITALLFGADLLVWRYQLGTAFIFTHLLAPVISTEPIDTFHKIHTTFSEFTCYLAIRGIEKHV